MKNIFLFFMLCFSLFQIPPALADTVYIANEAGHSIGVFSWSAVGKSTEYPVNGMPHNVQAAKLSGLILATIMDQNDHTRGILAVFDHKKMQEGPLKEISVGMHPAHVVTDSSGKKAYVTLSGENAVAVVDLDKGKILNKIKTGRSPHGLRTSPDGRELYVANMKEDTVSVIDVQNEREITRIKVGANPVQVAFTPDGKRAYVSLNADDAVAMVNTTTREVKKIISVNRGPVQLFANSTYLFVANQGTRENPGHMVTVIDQSTSSIIKEITVGNGPHGVNISADGKTVFVTNVYDNSVSIINADTLIVTETIKVGREPNGITSLP